MRNSKFTKTNIAYNPSLRKGVNDYDAVSAAYYVPPLPMAVSSSASNTPKPTVTIGNSGLWTFAEISDEDGVRLLSLKFRDQQVHTFLASEMPQG